MTILIMGFSFEGKVGGQLGALPHLRLDGEVTVKEGEPFFDSEQADTSGRTGRAAQRFQIEAFAVVLNT